MRKVETPWGPFWVYDKEKLAQLHGHTSADYRRWFEEHRYKTEPAGGCDILGVPL